MKIKITFDDKEVIEGEINYLPDEEDNILYVSVAGKLRGIGTKAIKYFDLPGQPVYVSRFLRRQLKRRR